MGLLLDSRQEVSDLMHRLIKNQELHLYGTVGGDLSWEEDGIKTTGFTDEQVIEALAEIEGDFSLRLNSAGGIAFQGIAIYNALRDHPGKVTIYIDALAASAASVIAMAGDTIVMRPGSMMMIHNPATITWGTAEEHRKAALTLDEIASAAAEIYARKSQKSSREILRMMSDETWMRGSVARSLGFADHADDEGERMAAPVFKYSLFRNAPADLFKPIARNPGAITTLPVIPVIGKEAVMTTQMTVKDATNEIFSRCRSASLNMDDTEKVILEAAGDANKARDLIINMLADRSGPEIRSHQPSGDGRAWSASPQLDEQLAEALVVQMGGQPKTSGDNHFIGRPVLSIARSFFENRGISLRDVNDVALCDMIVSGGVSIRARGAQMSGGMHTTSDFPGLLGTAMHRFLTERFNQSATPIKALSMKRNVSDFRKHSYVRPGESPELEEVIEGGEVRYGTLDEEANGLTIKTFAKLFSISRQALINDDLGAFSSSAQVFADGARKTENRKLFELLSANSMSGVTMDDGLSMFHSSHGNRAGTGSAISLASVTEGRTAMRLQTDVNGTGNAGVAPAAMLVGPKLETVAEQFVASINATKTSDANPFAGRLRVEVENQYDGFGWWLFADGQQRPAFQHGYLNGVEGPSLQQREGWDKLGMEFRAVLDFGCAGFDYRAGYFNPGVEP